MAGLPRKAEAGLLPIPIPIPTVCSLRRFGSGDGEAVPGSRIGHRGHGSGWRGARVDCAAEMVGAGG